MESAPIERPLLRRSSTRLTFNQGFEFPASPAHPIFMQLALEGGRFPCQRRLKSCLVFEHPAELLPVVPLARNVLVAAGFG
jgi:hypothetical protein